MPPPVIGEMIICYAVLEKVWTNTESAGMLYLYKILAESQEENQITVQSMYICGKENCMWSGYYTAEGISNYAIAQFNAATPGRAYLVDNFAGELAL